MKKLLKQPNFYFAIGILIMAILFYSSSMTYEQQSQVGLIDRVLASEPFKEQLSGIRFSYAGKEQSIAASGYGKFIEFFIRKGAHFFTYFVMGGSFCIGLYLKMKHFWWGGFFAWLAATGYAGMDEFHQQLTGGRTPLFEDVMLDSAGALTAVLIVLIVLLLRKKRLR
ncbi:VanZ family protein [Candidatus Enterococcus leclercqii]|uniref:VanZ family protein n=1 Tax=Enterococcus TaxID=1350 RepID=UPI00192A64EE|nr:VanZ family protein [Enterococcus sp. CU9D]KAF1293730.1 hypothetical protein BAU14_14035 [Enterococcus sp. CU9D]